jgi:hypothetical protein
MVVEGGGSGAFIHIPLARLRGRYRVSFNEPNEHSEQARAPHTHEPRDVPKCGALSLLQKPLH